MRKPKHTDSSLLGRKLRDRLQQRYPRLMGQMAGCLAEEVDTSFGGPRHWVYTIRRRVVEYGPYRETITADSIDGVIEKFVVACAAARLTHGARPTPIGTMTRPDGTCIDIFAGSPPP